jgi:uncharacterized membrane protein
MPGLPIQDMNEVLRWLLLLSGAGWLMLPLTRACLPGLADGGWLAARALGWFAAGSFAFAASSLGLASFAQMGPLVAGSGLAALFLSLRPRPDEGAPPLGVILRHEALFLALFALGLVGRLQDPNLLGLEKFTNLGFLTAILRADLLPPSDAWMAGQGINYYYFGHVTVALWANLAAVPVDHAYQLAMATLFALTGSLTFRIVAELLRSLPAALRRFCGLLAVALVMWGGNGHAFLYQALRGAMPTTLPEFYFPNSTRFIGFDPDLPDKAFTEFVAYGFKVGDLHAHVMATPLFLLGLIAALAVWRAGARGQGFLGPAGLFGWLAGLAYMTNAWDLAPLGLVALAVWAALWRRGPAQGRADRMLAPVLLSLAIAAATAAPFAASFRPFAAGLALTAQQSPVWQLAVIYFPWAGGVLALLALGLVARRGGGPSVELAFACLLAAAALLLVILPEIVFIDDIYGDDFARANTMFKLAFRSQHLLPILCCGALGWLAARPGARAGLAAALVLVPLALPLAYARWTFPLAWQDRRLDGLAFLGEERGLVETFAQLPLDPGQSFIEAGSNAFTGGARFATVSGRPAVLGWFGHEWLWRNDVEVVGARKAAIDAFYTTMDTPARCALIARHGIRYAVLAVEERKTYPELDSAGIFALGRVVAQSPAGAVVELLPQGRCKG